MKSYKIRAAMALLLAAATFTTSGLAQASDAGCSTAPNAGGDWTVYGGDLYNTRSQPAERKIDTTRAASLTPAFAIPLAAAGVPGTVAGTPIVAQGCVFIQTQSAAIGAFNADTGSLVWNRKFAVTKFGYSSNVGSPAYDNGTLYMTVNEEGNAAANRGPYLVKLDATTGDVLWTSPALDTIDSEFTSASPVPFNGMVFVGLSGGEASPRARGGFAIVDAATGAIVKHTYTINDSDYAKGYAGASVWGTPAIDLATGYAYAPGGNPASKKMESEFSNALLKIDVNPSRVTFGEIVGSFKGNADSYSRTIGQQPACDAFGDNPSLQIVGVWSASCLQLDLDFGASPHLYRNKSGRLLVGDLQKSGVYHAAFANTMSSAGIDLPVGVPCFACNAASPAVIGDDIFVAAAPPGQMVSIDGTAGLYQWASPIADGLHFQSVSAANGVVYTPDLLGYLNIYDAATGVLLAKRNMSTDAGGKGTSGNGANGVAIARNTVYAAAQNVLIAYR